MALTLSKSDVRVPAHRWPGKQEIHLAATLQQYMDWPYEPCTALDDTTPKQRMAELTGYILHLTQKLEAAKDVIGRDDIAPDLLKLHVEDVWDALDAQYLAKIQEW